MCWVLKRSTASKTAGVCSTTWRVRLLGLDYVTMKSVRHRVFTVDAAFASSNYRTRVTNDHHQCMHIRGFDLYGTILPPWHIDLK